MVPASSQNIEDPWTRKLFMPFLGERGNPHGKWFRLIGVRMEKLERFGIHAQGTLIDIG